MKEFLTGFYEGFALVAAIGLAVLLVASVWCSGS